jgi:hypothetical protein
MKDIKSSSTFNTRNRPFYLLSNDTNMAAFYANRGLGEEGGGIIDSASQSKMVEAVLHFAEASQYFKAAHDVGSMGKRTA